MRKLPRTSYTYLEILVPYLNPSVETIFESNKIRGQHETMKLQNEEATETLKTLISELNRPADSG